MLGYTDAMRAAEKAVRDHAQATANALSGPWAQLKAVFTGAAADLNNVFKAAFEGGGGIAGAIDSLATTLTEGSLRMIPIVGEFVSQFAGAIVAGFKKLGGFLTNLFGGPSEAERAGRDLGNEFIDGVIASANVSSDRIAAAVADGWDARLAEFALGVQDVFVAAGNTAEEGMAAVQRLFDAIKEGPDAVAVVIAEIEAMGIAIDDLPTDIDVKVNVDDSALTNFIHGLGAPGAFAVHGVGAPSFAHGSGGIQDFGTGTPSMLHGRERVQTEAQMRVEGQGGVTVVMNMDGAFIDGSRSADRLAARVGDRIVRQLERERRL